jgi:hypothetical protein
MMDVKSPERSDITGSRCKLSRAQRIWSRFGIKAGVTFTRSVSRFAVVRKQIAGNRRKLLAAKQAKVSADCELRMAQTRFVAFFGVCIVYRSPDDGLAFGAKFAPSVVPATQAYAASAPHRRLCGAEIACQRARGRVRGMIGIAGGCCRIHRADFEHAPETLATLLAGLACMTRVK